MGNKLGAQPYGAVTTNPKFTHATYFKSKGPVLVACLLPPEEAGVADASFHRVLICTPSGYQIFDFRSGRLLRSVSQAMSMVSVAVAINQRKTLAWVDAKKAIHVNETSEMREIFKFQSEDEVTALSMLPDGYFAYGSHSGKLRMVNMADSLSQEIPCHIQAKVAVLHHYKSLERDMIVAGFEADSSSTSSIFLFNHVRASNPFQQAITYPGLSGSCADVAIIETERVMLALSRNTALLSVWDLESCDLLLSLELAQNTELSRLLVIGEPTDTGKVRLAIAGKAGLMTGIFEISQDQVNWVQKTKSEASSAKIQPGSVTSLEFEAPLHLLIYGDDKGQTWVLDGPAPIENLPLIEEHKEEDS